MQKLRQCLMTFKRDTVVYFLWFYGLCLAVQLFGAQFSSMGMDGWYQNLDKSPLTPPGYVFGIAWTLLYFLMAWSATRIFHVCQSLYCRPLRWWMIQLILGLLWTIFFFGQHNPLAGLVIISIMVVAVITTTVLFWRLDDVAMVMLLPLVGWLTLATHLNLYIYLHN